MSVTHAMLGGLAKPQLLKIIKLIKLYTQDEASTMLEIYLKYPKNIFEKSDFRHKNSDVGKQTLTKGPGPW